MINKLRALLLHALQNSHSLLQSLSSCVSPVEEDQQLLVKSAHPAHYFQEQEINTEKYMQRVRQNEETDISQMKEYNRIRARGLSKLEMSNSLIDNLK